MKTISTQELKSISGGQSIVVTQIINVDAITAPCVKALRFRIGDDIDLWAENIIEYCTLTDFRLLADLEDNTPPYIIEIV